MNLYELSTAYVNFVNMLETVEDSETEQRFADTLDAIEDAIEVKADNIARVLRGMEVEKESIAAEVKRLTERDGRITKQIDQLEKYLQDNMQKTGKEKFKTALFNFSLRKSNQVVITNLDNVPWEYLNIKTTTVPDKKAIKQAIDCGIQIEGAMIQTNYNLQIK